MEAIVKIAIRDAGARRIVKLSAVAHACNSTTTEAEAGLFKFGDILGYVV